MKTFFASNLRLLRKSKGLSQTELADEVKSTRSNINNYENGAMPSVDGLAVISDYFGIGMDTLLRVDMTKLTQIQRDQVERYDNYLRGTYLRILAAHSDSKNRENISLESYA